MLQLKRWSLRPFTNAFFYPQPLANILKDSAQTHFHIYNPSRTASRALPFDFTMQLFDSVFVSLVLALLIPTALATPRKKHDPCAHLPKTYNSLPGNFSLEIFTRFETLESSSDKTRSFIRIFTEKNKKWDVPEVVVMFERNDSFRFPIHFAFPHVWASRGGRSPRLVVL